MEKPPKTLSHLDARGHAHMVDVGDKPETRRTAFAQARVRLPPACAEVFAKGGIGAKGDVLGVARLAGIMAAKRTAELIPLCHPLPIDKITVDLVAGADAVVITANVRTTGRTGVEMEALTAVSVAALTVYDMLKGLSHDIVIEYIELLRKEGGRSGVIDRTGIAQTESAPVSPPKDRAPVDREAVIPVPTAILKPTSKSGRRWSIKTSRPVDKDVE
jgi:cyclic pyranopterin phosphate synthase